MRINYRGGPINRPWSEPWLVQRLEKPLQVPEGHILHGKDNPFTFGGGLRNGGLTDEAMDLLRPIFAFDYMGAAEFEFGAVQRALQSMGVSVENLSTSSFEIDLGKMPWWEFDRRYFKKPKLGDKKSVYVLAHKDHHKDAKKYIRSFTRKVTPRLKVGTLFRESLFDPVDPDGYTKVCGWLDIENCLMWFVDREMFEKTRDLFLGAPKESAS